MSIEFTFCAFLSRRACVSIYLFLIASLTPLKTHLTRTIVQLILSWRVRKVYILELATGRSKSVFIYMMEIYYRFCWLQVISGMQLYILDGTICALAPKHRLQKVVLCRTIVDAMLAILRLVHVFSAQRRLTGLRWKHVWLQDYKNIVPMPVWWARFCFGVARKALIASQDVEWLARLGTLFFIRYETQFFSVGDSKQFASKHNLEVQYQ